MKLILFGLLYSLDVLLIAHCKEVPMVVVEEPSNYGVNFGGAYQNNDNTETPTLQMRIPPSNFSGPQHLHRLYGKCFTRTDDSYKYEFCPFSNVTQHEQSLRWNPYSGVLGVWQEWEIENNTFVSMMMREGDACGSKFRTVKVLFKCGDKTDVLNVTEPDTCNYELIFSTPLVCHPHSMLVYPTLTKDLQHEWDLLEGQLQIKDITPKGYTKYLRQLFEKAGLQIPEKKKEEISHAAAEAAEKKAKEDEGDFESLAKCTEEYKKLKEKVEGLQALLELNGIAPDGTVVKDEAANEGMGHYDGHDWDSHMMDGDL